MAEPDLAISFAPTLAAFLEPRLRLGSRVCLGLSGGRDSVVLLHALSRMARTLETPIRLSAVHVHHGLSPNADSWADFCRAFSERCSVPLDIVRVEVPRDSGEGLEAAARRMRHGVFASRDADWLALAHHRDDQAETVLLNLLRGAGIAGAAGMLPERPQARGPALIRPLLGVPRREIETYAETHGLRWIDDESNADVHFRRNFLRRDVIPRLEDKFPGTQRSLARAAGHFAEGAGLLDDLAAIDRATVLTPSGRIGLPAFNDLAPARARNLLRYEWLRAGFRAPDTRWIDEARHQLSTADHLSETCVTTPEAELRVYRGELYIVRHRPDTSGAILPWRGETVLPWAGGRVRFVECEGEGVKRGLLETGDTFIRSRCGGERLQTHPARPRRSLRNLLQEASIPAWERNYLPCLWHGDQLAWVAGLGVEVRFACPAGERGVLPIWEPD